MNSRERLPVGPQRVIYIRLLPSSVQMVLLRRGWGALPITSLPPGPPSSPSRWPTSSGDPFRTEHLLEEDRSPPAVRGNRGFLLSDQVQPHFRFGFTPKPFSILLVLGELAT